jgi:hypothetical protein
MTATLLTVLPGMSQSLALACLMAVALGFVVIGAALGGRDRLAEADLLTGWSVVAGLYVVAGGALDLRLTLVALLALALVLVSAVVLWRRRDWPLETGTLKILAWMSPLLLATASMQPSQWDEFAQWLPNARYLALFDVFPSPGHPASDSVFPGYPPGMTVVFHLSGLLAGSFVDTVAPWFNLLLLAVAARMMIRLFEGETGGNPGWAVAAWGVLGVTALGTTFVPKLVLSAYADNATAVTMAVAAVLGLRLMERQGGLGRLIQFAAVFALLPMTKQGNFALMGLLALALAADGLRQGGRVRLGLMILGGALLPAIVVALAWRLHLASSGGDMPMRAFADWQWNLLPQTLTSMAHVIMSKGGYFGFGIAILALTVLGRMKRPEYRLARLFAVTFAGYNLFLLFVYLAILGGYESATAASYWRYNTHLGVLEMLAVALLAGAIARRVPVTPPVARAALLLAGAAVVIGPFAGAKYFRFDRQPAKMHALESIRDMAAMARPPHRLMVIDTRGSGFYAHYTDYHLGFGTQVVASVSVFNPNGVAANVKALKPDYLWVRTLSPAVAAELNLTLDDRASHLLARNDDGLHLVRSWPYPDGLDPAVEKD